MLKNFLTSKLEEYKSLCVKSADATLSDQRALAEEAMAVLGLIVVGAIFFIGLAISSGIIEAIALNNTSPFYNASLSITSGLNSSYSMGAVLLIVMIAGAIIYSLLRSFGGIMFGGRSQ